MLEHVDLVYTGSIKDLAGKIRPILSRRGVVRIPGFSRNQIELRNLAVQLGIAMTIPGSSTRGPLNIMNQSDAVDAPWYRSTAPLYRHIASDVPAIVLDYCVEPTNFIRWFCDHTEVYKRVSQTVAESDLRRTRIGNLAWADFDNESMKNLYQYGVEEIFVDRAHDLFVHICDGISTGRVPGDVPRQGLWIREMVTPDWELMQPSS